MSRSEAALHFKGMASQTQPLEKKEQKPCLIKKIATDIIVALKGCFCLKSQNDKWDADLSFQNMSGTSVSTDISLYKSSSSILSRRHSCNDQPAKGNGLCTFTMNEMIKATRNFSPSLKIGQGGFGVVYKGKLKDGRVVAVKRAKKWAYDQHLTLEFMNEVTTLSKVEHLNLVKLIGFLEEKSERILIFEFVPNGNLRQHLDGKFGSTLDLTTRLDIAIDVAHALTYLHSYADESFIHRDVKSSNILLTDTFRAKVADFGFSRVGPPWELNTTHVSTQVKGTAGYLDPEYIQTNQLTQKSDVYSFGVLLVEIVSGRHPVEPRREINERMTSRWAFEMYRKGNIVDILDPKFEHTTAAIAIVEKVISLASQCAALRKQDRPTMRKTAETLWNIRKDHHSLLHVPPS